MATLSQLQGEVWWNREYQPPSMATLCEQLRVHFGVSPNALGSKGDANHLYGYHRSRAWVVNSHWSAYGWGDYSVQAAADQDGDANWLCAVDFTPGNADTMIAMSQRLAAAVQAGRCPQLREWYGNVDGDQVVDGWDLLANRAATSDSSHLWHVHMSFLRARAGDDHANLFAILTGEDDMMSPEQDNILKATDQRLWQSIILGNPSYVDSPGTNAEQTVWIVGAINSVAAAVNDIQASLATPVPVTADAAAVAAALAADPAFLAALSKAAFDGAQRAERE